MKLPTLLNGITLLMRSISALKIPPTPVSAPQNTTVQWINTQGTEPFNSTETGPCANLPLLSRLQCMLVGIGSPHGEVATEIVPPPPRQMEEQADQYLFNMTLESFISLRDQRYPSYFFWESDGCSQSPDAPFGFPFLPACYRHDFGYDQYKKQDRFTPGSKDKLDRNFRSDLYHICSDPDLKPEICEACAEDPHRKDIDCKHRTDMCQFPANDVCKCLADIYYTAVKQFGRKQKRRQKRDLELGGFKIPISSIGFPSIDITKFGLCLNKNLHSEYDKPVG